MLSGVAVSYAQVGPEDDAIDPLEGATVVDDQPEGARQMLTAEQVIERARAKIGAVQPQKRCLPSVDENIVVVCADDGAAYRVPPSKTSRAALGGPPPAPDVAGAGIFHGPATAGGMCFIPPCPRELPPDVDFSKLPEIDEEYQERARAAALAERARQRAETQNDPVNNDPDNSELEEQP